MARTDAGVAAAVVETDAGEPESAAADASPPEDPREELTRRTYDVIVLSGLAYRGTTAGVVIEEATDPAQPVRLGILHLPGSVGALEWLGRIEVPRGTACPESPRGDSACVPPGPGNYLAALLGPGGVALVDVTDPTNPVEAARFDTAGAAMGAAWAPPLLYVADGTAGLAVLDLTIPPRPREVGRWDSATAPACAAGAAGATDAAAGCDCPGCAAPRAAYARDVWVDAQGAVAYVAAGARGLVAFDAASLRREGDAGAAEARVIAVVDTPGDARAVTVREDLAYVADGPSGLQVVDLATAAREPEQGIVGSYATPDMCRGVAVEGDRAYLAVGDRGLVILDVSDPASPFRLGEFVPDRPVNRVAVGSGGILYLANDSGGLTIVDASAPTDVRRIYPKPDPDS